MVNYMTDVKTASTAVTPVTGVTSGNKKKITLLLGKLARYLPYYNNHPHSIMHVTIITVANIFETSQIVMYKSLHSKLASYQNWSVNEQTIYGPLKFMGWSGYSSSAKALKKEKAIRC